MDSESGWPGSGGGISLVFSRPAYQTGGTIPAGSKRLFPDVSLVAAPETGAYVRVNGQNKQIGGTSSAPGLGRLLALLNESRVKAGKPTLPFLNPILYKLTADDKCLRDIVGNSNGDFEAVPGYDMVTGLGVPDVKKLVLKLTAQP